MPRILIVDDDTASCRTLQLHLSNQGYAVDLAHGVDEGLAVATLAKPDLIILDILMPQKDGGEVLSELRQDPYLRNIPVILLTGLADEATAISRLGGIESSVFGKPVEFRVLVQEIDRQLGRQVA